MRKHSSSTSSDQSSNWVWQLTHDKLPLSLIGYFDKFGGAKSNGVSD